MGSQTLEILRQGVWASLTGGWFYDPHQNVFCNAVHLYLWMFLLCTPFVTYLYFPKTITTWGLYCLTTGLIVAVVKVVNLALHVMYDEAQIISDNHLKQSIKALRETPGDENGGIEMQVLSSGANGSGGPAAAVSTGETSMGNNNSNEISQANSALSIDYPEQVASTIDLKVDVHRKNSSESSDISIGQLASVHWHFNSDMRGALAHQLSLKTKSKSEDASATSHRCPISEETVGDYASGKTDEMSDQFADIESSIREKQKKKMRSKLQRQISLDSEQGAGMGLAYANDPIPMMQKLQRHRSTETNAEHHRRTSKAHHNKGSFYNPSNSLQPHLQSVPSDLLYYIPDDEDDYLTQQKTPMRKDSNSTMSALQLPTGAANASGLSASSRARRHSNSTGKPGSMVSVRRIKSAALETCCPQPSVSNLSPHPNSVETIGGKQTLRNPQHSMLPPPSKSLVRNQHFNLYTSPGSSTSMPSTLVTSAPLVSATATIEAVYPIVEQADERSMSEFLHYDTQESDDSEDDDDDNENEDDDEDDEDEDDDDENDVDIEDQATDKRDQERRSTTSESDVERVQTQSTDSDTENNGSRSPLLDLKSRSAYFLNKTTVSEKKQLAQAAEKLRKSTGNTVVSGTTNPVNVVATNQNTKSEDSGCPSSDCDQASASSKDMLLTTSNSTSTTLKDKSSAGGERMWFDFSMDSNNISVDVTDPGEGSSKMLSSASKELKESSTSTVNGRSLGAIPKIKTKPEQFDDQYYDEIENIIRKSMDADVVPQVSSSRASSWSTSSRRFSGGSATAGTSNDYERPPVEVLHQTKDGWAVKSSSTNPVHASARGDPPPLIPIYSARRPYVCFHTPGRPSLIMRSITRNRNNSGHNQAASYDPTTLTADASFRDEEMLTKNLRTVEREGYSLPEDIRDTANILRVRMFEAAQPTDRLQQIGVGGGSNGNSGLVGGDPNSGSISADVGSSNSHHIPVHQLGNVDFGGAYCEYWRYNLPPEKQIQPKRFYKYPFRCFGRHEIKIAMDRLQLMALLDRDFGWCQALLGILLAALVSVLGATVLRLTIYRDLFAFIFCFVIAGSQYSLLKSVQPDAASPIHGFNKTVAYSRPIYFCMCAAVLVFAHNMATEGGHGDQMTIFSVVFVPTDFFVIVEYIMSLVLLMLPIFFSLGLFPQINTFLMYVLEQLDMHVFGGSAVCSLLAAFLGIFRSLLACLMLFGPAFGGLAEPRGTQHILFSCFCALLVAVSYHLSRSASDVSCLWQLVKSSLVLHTDDDEEDKEKSQTDQTDVEDEDKGLNDPSSPDLSPAKSTVGDAVKAVAALTPPPPPLTSLLTALPTSDNKDADLEDPLPRKLQNTVNARLKNDFLVCLVSAVLTFSLHCSTVFTVLQPELRVILYLAASVLGFVLHYVIPQLRKHLPWLCFANPVLRQYEFGQFEPREAARVMWFEKTYVYACFFERNVLYPLLFLSALTADASAITQKFGGVFGAAIVVVCGLKCVRSCYSDPSSQYMILVFSVLFFLRDFKSASETFLIDYFVVAIVYKKFCEFLLKLQFIVTYIAPWQITWGSAFHAFAQPFSVPHSAMLFLQAAISAVLSTPLNPFLGSAIFLTSYVRPIKFWERDYNTRRIDHSNTRLSSQLERDLGADDNNLNSIFYEHLTRSLQHSLCGDLLLGRWGNVSQGDCFVLASDYLNCMVHIIELGNGLCTFQMRGLEFRGTYCQQREVEAISEGVDENDGCCCCAPGHLPHMLSVNAMFSTRWLAWQVVASKYVLEGYSISDNLAQATLQVFEFRKVLISYYVKSIIYYTIRSPKLDEWLQSPAIQEALQPTLDRGFVDLDPIFNHNLDEDFDFRCSGITRLSFCNVYMNWIQFCHGKRYKRDAEAAADGGSGAGAPTVASSTDASKRTSPRSSGNPTPSPRGGCEHSKPKFSKMEAKPADDAGDGTTSVITRESSLVSLLLGLGLLARRTLATASHNNSLVTVVELFLHGLHALFKGDFRITSQRDEWVFADMDLLHSVVAPAVKMALKLHQDHFLSPEEYDDPAALYEAINTHTKELVISHEADPLWRNAVLRGAPNLLALRHVMEDGSDEYRLIRLTKRFLSFRVIKVNRECVRGLWAGQQQELIYLRNRNPERGSIQNAKQALRNIINSSCDQPIGYPIYVSPLTTSYAETNEQLSGIVGGAITLEKIHKLAVSFCQRVRKRCREGCSSGSGAAMDTELGDIHGVYCNAPTPNNTLSGTTGTLSYGSQSLSGAGNRGSLASMGKPTNSTLFAGLLNREQREPESVRERGVKRRNSVLTERDRRLTVPSTRNCETPSGEFDPIYCAAMSSSVAHGTAPAAINYDFKHQLSMEAYIPAASVTAHHHHHLKPNSSFSSGHLASRNNRNIVISIDRKSKSEERHTSREREDLDERQRPQPDTLPPPRISLNRKVIIVDAGEIYDCLDLGRRIDVVWPNEAMRSSGGRSSWKEWTPQEGMVGFIVHYWQPNHPDAHFRSNFNRTLFLLQIGDRYVPVGETGVKEYNTVGLDERIKIVPMLKDELGIVESLVDCAGASGGGDAEIPEERSDDESEEAGEDFVLSRDHSV